MSGPVGYLQLLRSNTDFRRVWLAEVISFLGDWFNTIALYAAVEQLSNSTGAIVTVFVAKMLPVFLMTPVAGPLIDRLDRRRLLIATDVARAVCAVGLIGAYRLRSLTLLIALIVVMVCFSGIFIPTKTAVVPQVTSRKNLGVANALSAGTWSTMLALGAAAGGLVTALVGIEVALLIDALTFLLSAAFLFPLPQLLPTPDEPGKRKTDRSFRAGLRYLCGHRYLAAIIALKPCLALAGGALAMLPVFGTRLFEGTSGPRYMGLLYTARGLGALIGSLAIRKLFGDAPHIMRRLIGPAFMLIAVSYVGLSYAANIWQAAFGYFLTAVGGGTIWVFSGTLGQLESDNAFRGRVFAVEWGAMTLVMSLVAMASGGAVDRLGRSVREVVLASACLMVVPILLWLLVLLRRRDDADGAQVQANSKDG